MHTKHIISEILRDNWLIDRSYATAYFPQVFSLLQGNAEASRDEAPELDDQKELSTQRPNSRRIRAQYPHFIAEDGNLYNEYDEMPVEGDFTLVIPVVGPIAKYDYCGDMGTRSMIHYLETAQTNPRVKKVIMHIDSGGGAVHGTFDLVQALKAIEKPTEAYVEGWACSAAYWIASACDTITLNNAMAEVGSIGAYTTMLDFTKYYEELGVKISEVYAEQSTKKNKEYRQFKDSGKTELALMSITEICEFFHQSVKTNRPGIAEECFTGDVYSAEQAIKLGLADRIATLNSPLVDLENGPEGNEQANQISNHTMFTDKKKLEEATAQVEQLTAQVGELNTSLESATAAFQEAASLFPDHADEGFSLPNAIKATLKANTSLVNKVSDLEAKLEEVGTRTAVHPAAPKAEGNDNVGQSTEEKLAAESQAEMDSFSHNQEADKLLNG